MGSRIVFAEEGVTSTYDASANPTLIDATVAAGEIATYGKYLVIAGGQMRSGVAANYAALHVEVDGDTPFVDGGDADDHWRLALIANEHSAGAFGDFWPLTTIAVVDSPSTSIALVGSGEATTTYLSNGYLIILDISDLTPDEDYYQSWTNHGAKAAATSWTEEESLTITPTATSEKWLIMGIGHLELHSHAYTGQWYMEAPDDANIVTQHNAIGSPSGDTNNEATFQYIWTSPDTDAATFKLYSKCSNTGADILASQLFALRLDAISTNYGIDQDDPITDGDFEIIAPIFTTVDTGISVTLTPANDVLILGGAHLDAATGTGGTSMYWTDDDDVTTLPSGHSDASNTIQYGHMQSADIVSAWRATAVIAPTETSTTYKQYLKPANAAAYWISPSMVALELRDVVGSIQLQGNVDYHPEGQFFTHILTDTLAARAWSVNRATTGYTTALVDRPMFLFDGSDDYMEVVHDESLNASSDFTALIVLRVHNQAAESRAFTKTAGGGATDTGWSIAIEADTDAVAELSNGTTEAANTHTLGMTPLSELKLLVFRLNAVADELDMFVDGVPTTTTSTTHTETGTVALRVGTESDGGAPQSMEEIGHAIWSRALTNTEIRDLVDYFGIPTDPVSGTPTTEGTYSDVYYDPY